MAVVPSAGGCDRRAKAQAAATGAPSAAERSHPTSEVRGRSWEDPVPEGQQPRGVTPCPRSGQRPRVPECEGAGTAERSYPLSEVGGGGREEIPHTPCLRPGATGGRSYPTPLSPRPRAAVGRSNPTTEARGGGQEDQPHIQGA